MSARQLLVAGAMVTIMQNAAGQVADIGNVGNRVAEWDRAKVVSKAPVVDPSAGDSICATDYDYGWNHGTRRMVETYFPGNPSPQRVHFTFMHRDLDQPPPFNQRVQAYVFSDGVSYTRAAPTIPYEAGQSGFGDISVFRSTTADGIVVIPSHNPVRAAFGQAPGDTLFAYSTIPRPRPPRFGGSGDPFSAVKGRSDSLYVVTSGAERDEVWVFLTTDFGQTWQFLDSLRQFGPLPRLSGAFRVKDCPVLVGPDGRIIVFNSMRGTGAIPPLDTASAALANRTGYFTSSDAGVTWSWRDVAIDGAALLPTRPGEYAMAEVLGKMDAVLDRHGTIHLVLSAPTYRLQGSDTLFIARVLYWNSATGTFASLGSDEHSYDPDYSIYRALNGRGWVTPTLSIEPESGAMFAAWAQPQYTGGRLDTANGLYMSEIWWTYSENGGVSWAPARNLTQTVNRSESFPSSSRLMTVGPNGRKIAHLLYLSELRENNGFSVFTGTRSGKSPWIYRTTPLVTGVETEEGPPPAFLLAQNYPNPFNPVTVLNYTLARGGHVSLTVTDLLGRRVATVVDEEQPAGSHNATFTAAGLASGVYFYTLRSGGFTATRRMLLMR